MNFNNKYVIDLKKPIILSLLILASIVEIITSIKVTNVPVFADGTQHVWITSYIKSTGVLPRYDITGIQPTNFSVPISIDDSKPFIYQPLFYILAGTLSTFDMTPKTAVEILNIFPPLIIALFFLIICKRLFNDQVAVIAFCLISLSSLWPWMVVHRLVEPIIILLFAALVYAFYKYSETKVNTWLLLVVIFLVSLLGIKQSVYPIIIASLVSLFLFSTVKRAAFFSGLFFVLLVPIFYFSVITTHSPIPTPIGIHSIDNLFHNAWWNQQPKKWEQNLNQESNYYALKKETYSQFKIVQKSPANLYDYSGALGILNEFSLYPLTPISTEGYQSTVPFDLYLLFLLIIVAGIVAIFEQHNRRKIITQGKIIFSFLSLVILFSVGLWLKQPVFRYYIYVLLFSVILMSLGIELLLRKSHIWLNLLFVLILLTSVAFNLVNELSRDNLYRYTAMHKQVPNNAGGLNDSINFGRKVAYDNKPDVFTPMVEIAYYSGKSQIWDDRLFFVNNKQNLISYLKNYNFHYVVLPFYSGQLNTKSWTYDRGVPSDSTFYALLSDPKYSTRVENNHTFTAYKLRIDSE